MVTEQIPLNRRVTDPGLCEVLDQLGDSIKQTFNCHSIGTIQSFDPVDQTATVNLNYKKISLYDGSIKDYQGLVKCPVVIINGGGAFLSFPIAAGDSCLVMFCDREIDTWWQYGGVNAPKSARIHDLNDGVALVGIRNSRNPIANYDPLKAVWSFLTGLFSAVDKTGERLCQPGFLQPYAGASAPSGWLMCYGQSISKATYPELYDIIGYTYGGSGDNFNVPDMRGRDFVGLDNIGGSQADVLTAANTPNRNVLGGAVGEERHQLTVPELATHSHPITFSQYGNAGTSGLPIGSQQSYLNYSGGTANEGSNTPHNTVQPGRMGNWIIKI